VGPEETSAGSKEEGEERHGKRLVAWSGTVRNCAFLSP